MKFLLPVCFSLSVMLVAQAQSNNKELQANDRSLFKENNPKVTIRCMDKSTLSGRLVSITDSAITLMLRHDSSGEVFQSVPVPQIRYIRIKKNAFWMGAACGAVLGAIVGYSIGKVNTEQNSYLNEDEDDVVKGLEYAGIAMVPAAVVGSMVGSIWTKRRFRVDGNRKKYEDVLYELRQSMKFQLAF